MAKASGKSKKKNAATTPKAGKKIKISSKIKGKLKSASKTSETPRKKITDKSLEEVKGRKYVKPLFGSKQARIKHTK